MYEMEHAGLECIDPRDESSIVKAVQRHETAFNQNSANIAVDGQRTEFEYFVLVFSQILLFTFSCSYSELFKII